MNQGYVSNHWNDSNGNPAGGCTFGTGFTISWQNGPLGRGPDRRPPNGAFVEDIISAALDRLQFYQSSRFACPANQDAINHLHLALLVLQTRTEEREKRGVEGTHQS